MNTLVARQQPTSTYNYTCYCLLCEYSYSVCLVLCTYVCTSGPDDTCTLHDVMLLCVSCRPTSTGESPTLVARHLIRRHNQLTLPDSPSQGSTPAELAEEEVSKLSDQVCTYRMRLVCLTTFSYDVL